MTIMRYLLWVGLTVMWYAILTLCQYPVRKKKSIILNILSVPVKIFLAMVVAYEIFVVENTFVYRFGLPLAALNVALFGDAVGDILSLPAVIKKHDKTVRIQSVLCLICTAAYLTFGTVNMQTVRAKRFTITSDKLSNSYKVAFLADLHVGTTQSFSTTESTLHALEAEEPDFIVLGGDIVDEYTTKEEMEKTFELIGDLKPPVYFIYGNHDVQPGSERVGGHTFTPEELENAILSNGIQILKDEWISYSDDLVIFGRDVYSSEDKKPLDEISPRPDNAFVLLVNHSPFEYQDIADSKADLQLSGHSHAGQFFPMQWIYQLAGYEEYGFYHHGNTDVYVTCGASGWCFPFRTPMPCQYEVVTLEPGSPS